MKEIDILTQKYLDGTTTLQEERRLGELIGCKLDATVAEKVMAEMLVQRRHSEDEMELWLTEDETELYDTIMRLRRRRRIIRKLIAAASVVIVISVTFWFNADRKAEQNGPVVWQKEATDYGQKTEKPIRQLYAKTANTNKRFTKRLIVATKELLQNTDSVKSTESKTIEKTVAKIDDMPPTEKIQDLIAGIEAKMEEIGDSVYIAHIERMIYTDRKQNDLVDKMITLESYEEYDTPPIYEDTDISEHNF